MLYSPSLPPSLFSLASSPCSHGIPLPTEAESRSSGIAHSPRRSRSSLELGWSHCTALAESSRQSPAPGSALSGQSIHSLGTLHVPHFLMSKQGAAGAPCVPQHPRGVPSAHTDTVVAPLGYTSDSQLLVLWERQRVMARVGSVPLKPLRFMHALKGFAKSTPPRWGWDSSH